MLVRLRDSYVVAEGLVTLDVEVGEGQKSFVEVLLNGTPIASGAAIKALSVGQGSAIAGKKLRITTTVTDTNTNTNRTSVTYTLKGGKATQTFKSAHEVDSPGGTVDYDAIFRLL